LHDLRECEKRDVLQKSSLLQLKEEGMASKGDIGNFGWFCVGLGIFWIACLVLQGALWILYGLGGDAFIQGFRTSHYPTWVPLAFLVALVAGAMLKWLISLMFPELMVWLMRDEPGLYGATKYGVRLLLVVAIYLFWLTVWVPVMLFISGTLDAWAYLHRQLAPWLEKDAIAAAIAPVVTALFIFIGVPLIRLVGVIGYLRQTPTERAREDWRLTSRPLF
jgi:hypothetical protein